MIFWHSKTQLLTTWLALGFILFNLKKKKKSKSCHVGKGSQELCLVVTMYHIFYPKEH